MLMKLIEYLETNATTTAVCGTQRIMPVEMQVRPETHCLSLDFRCHSGKD